MAFDYDEIAAEALELLTDFGSTATLTRGVAGTYNPAVGLTPGTPTTETVTCAIFDYPLRVIDGTRILTGDKQALMSAVGVLPPKPGDTLTWQSTVYTVVTSKPLAPAGTDVLHDVQVRGAF